MPSESEERRVPPSPFADAPLLPSPGLGPLDILTPEWRA